MERSSDTEKGLVRSPLSMGECDSVFIGTSRVVRVMRGEIAMGAFAAYQAGLFQELHRAGFMPEILALEFDAAQTCLTLTVAKIEPITYPFEWSPTMLQRAALCTLEVNRVAGRFGFELCDAHPYNIVFDFNTPKFVDFGSFVPQLTPTTGWVAYDEFMSAFYHPLEIRSKGMVETFGLLYLNSGGGIGRVEASRMLRPWLRLIPSAWLRMWYLGWSLYRAGPGYSPERLRRRVRSSVLLAVILYLLKAQWLPFRRTDMTKLMARVRAIRFEPSTRWGNYQANSGLSFSGVTDHLSPRFRWVIDNVRRLAPKRVLELAGNQGALAIALVRTGAASHVICSDLDEGAVDWLHNSLEASDRITPACFNFLGEEWQSLSHERSQRLRSPVVIALAVTHHILLGQKFGLEAMFRILTKFCTDYLIVEFMPLGLWDGKASEPLPDWYSEKAFVSAMEMSFEIVERAELEANRVAYLARVK